MAKKVTKSKVEADNSPQEVVAAEVVEASPPKKKEMTTIQKVQLMSSLAGIATDPEVEKILKNRQNGDVVYDVFIESVEKKLKEIMEGNPEETKQQVTSVLAAVGRMDVTIRELQRVMIGFMDTPLIGVLNLLNGNLGGTKFEFNRSAIENAMPAEVKNVPPPRPAQQNPVQNQHPINNNVNNNQTIANPQPVTYNRPARGSGAGSW